MAAGKKNKKSNTLLVTGIIILTLTALALFKTFGPGTGTFATGEFLYVHTGSDYEKLMAELTMGGFISDKFSFDLLARAAKLPLHVHAGKYKISKGMSNFAMVRMLRSGRQVQVRLLVNKLRTRQDLITLISTNLEADSATLKELLNDRVYLAKYGLDTNTVMCAVLPNTYFFKWNTPADKAFKKLEDNYARFWDDAHKKAAKDHGLTPVKATIVASIVDEETNMNEDKPKIASVYLNRLDKGMKLQADPTVKFAIGDFTIRRVTGPMLQNTSPYNTYMYTGLPPGPICTPSVSSIEAVLQSPKTTYLYFCAKEDFSGYSNFASNYDEQIKNAHAYQKALDARGIR
jgi:UPF0755 protein